MESVLNGAAKIIFLKKCSKVIAKAVGRGFYFSASLIVLGGIFRIPGHRRFRRGRRGRVVAM